MDSETAKVIDDLRLTIFKVKYEALATRVAFMAMAQTHPDPKNLSLAFEAFAERTIAATLPQVFPDVLVEHLQDELDRIREFLRSI